MAGSSESFHGIPVWEITVFVAAVVLILIILLLWWLFGYSFVVAPSTETAVELPATSLMALLA
jgi:hypothetical protein